MSYHPEQDSHTRDKVKVVLDFSNYATKKELYHTTGVDTSNLAVKKDSIALKAEVDKLDIKKLANFPTSFNNLSDVVDNKVIKNTKLNTLKTQMNNSEKKTPDASTLTHINQ